MKSNEYAIDFKITFLHRMRNENTTAREWQKRQWCVCRVLSCSSYDYYVCQCLVNYDIIYT